jgi:hypothetical protein
MNGCLRRVFNTVWPEKMLNEHLWQMAKEKPIIQQIKERKWEVDRAHLEERFTGDRETGSVEALCS